MRMSLEAFRIWTSWARLRLESFRFQMGAGERHAWRVLDGSAGRVSGAFVAAMARRAFNENPSSAGPWLDGLERCAGRADLSGKAGRAIGGMLIEWASCDDAGERCEICREANQRERAKRSVSLACAIASAGGRAPKMRPELWLAVAKHMCGSDPESEAGDCAREALAAAIILERSHRAEQSVGPVSECGPYEFSQRYGQWTAAAAMAAPTSAALEVGLAGESLAPWDANNLARAIASKALALGRIDRAGARLIKRLVAKEHVGFVFSGSPSFAWGPSGPIVGAARLEQLAEDLAEHWGWDGVGWLLEKKPRNDLTNWAWAVERAWAKAGSAPMAIVGMLQGSAAGAKLAALDISECMEPGTETLPSAKKARRL